MTQIRQTLFFAGSAAIALGCFLAIGFPLLLPASAGAAVVLIALPIGLAVAEAGRMAARLGRGLQVTAGFVAGLAMIASWRSGRVAGVVTSALLAGLLVKILIDWKWALHLAVQTVSLVLLGVTVLYLNYVLLSLRANTLLDPVFLTADRSVYRFVFGAVDYVNLFPLIRTPAVFHLFENAYLTLAVQPFVVVMSCLDHPAYARRFLQVTAFTYGVAMAVFLVCPAVGPTLYRDDSFDASYSETVTGQAIAAMRTDYRQVAAGKPPITGYGYFIAFPSLHAALTTLCCMALGARPLAFGVLLSAAALLVPSTVLLGHHYLIDPIAGVALGLFASRWLTLVEAS